MVEKFSEGFQGKGGFIILKEKSFERMLWCEWKCGKYVWIIFVVSLRAGAVLVELN